MKAISGKLKIKSFLCLLVLTLIFLTPFSSKTMGLVYPQTSEPELFVEPQDNIFDTWMKKVNDTVIINVTVANVTNLCGVQFKLRWDPALLKGVSMEEVLFSTLTPYGEEDNIWEVKHLVADDHVEYAYTYMDASRAVSGGYAPFNITVENGFPQGKMTIATITLQILKDPPPEEYIACNLDIYDSILGDVEGEEILHQVIDGYYKLIAPLPILKVEPAVYEAMRRNETFQVNITINNLYAGWEVVGVEFKLGYDPSLLEMVNVTEGPFMQSFAGPPNQGTLFMKLIGDNFVRIGVTILADENGTWHEPFPSGNGTLATVNFKVIYGPAVSCSLELYDIMVANWNTTLINYTKVDGAFRFSAERLCHDIVFDGQTFGVVTLSNSTISPVPIKFSQRFRMIAFNVTGEEGALCFVNITIPKGLLWLESPEDEWLILVGGEKVIPTVGENATYTWLYFTFTTSQKPVYIFGTGVIPELPTMILPLLILTAASAMIILLGRRSKKMNSP